MARADSDSTDRHSQMTLLQEVRRLLHSDYWRLIIIDLSRWHVTIGDWWRLVDVVDWRRLVSVRPWRRLIVDFWRLWHQAWRGHVASCGQRWFGYTDV